jgi:hypothetical protein
MSVIYNVFLSSLFSNDILTAIDVACSRVVTDLPEWQLTVKEFQPVSEHVASPLVRL